MNIGAVLRSLSLGIVWVVLAALIALGAAGIVASMNRMPGTDGRPELTWTGDEAARPALDAATDQLQTLSDQVDALGTTARQALTQVNAGDIASLSTTIANGTQQTGTVGQEATKLETSLSSVPGVTTTPELRLSNEMIQRYQALAATQGLTHSLAADWTAFSGRALNAATLTSVLASHEGRRRRPPRRAPRPTIGRRSTSSTTRTRPSPRRAGRVTGSRPRPTCPP